MLCGEMSAPGRQLPVGQIYAARLRDSGTAQTGVTQINLTPSSPLVACPRTWLSSRAAVRSEPDTHN